MNKEQVVRLRIPVPDSKEPRLSEPFALSRETAEATLRIMGESDKTGKVSEANVRSLVRSLGRDARENGISMTPEEEKAWEQSVTESLTAQPKGENPAFVPENLPEDFNIAEYAKTVDYVTKLYDVQKHTGNLGLIESVLVANKIAGLSTVTGLFGTIKKGIGQMDEIKALGQDIFLNKAVGGKIKLSADQKSKAWALIGKNGWPLYAPILAKIPLVATSYFIKKHFIKSMEGVRGAINQRIAESVFMRDYEFVHDKSAAEIMDKVIRGKESTIHLLEKTYLEMVPALAEVGGSILPQVNTNPLGAALAGVRIAVGYSNGVATTKDILTKRKEILNRQNRIDTRIMTSLSSLETVKTSDSMQEAITDLEQSMKARDQVARDMSQKQIRKGLQQEVTDYAMTKGIPVVTAAYDMLRATGTKHVADLWDIARFNWENIPDKRLMSELKGVGKGVLSYTQSSLSQSAMEGGINKAVAIYADDIKPALQDIKRMEELLGPYDLVDRPGGIKEAVRIPVSTLKSYDIRVKGLSFKNILHGVNMDIPQGSFVTIKGPSGIGKTTFFRHLVGLYGAESGVVTYGGVDLQGIKKFGNESIYTKIAYANQSPQYFEDLTLKDNLLLWTKQQVPDAKIRTVLHDLKLDHIMDRMHSKVKHFSGGELRRIGIARALLKDPKVLFLDEPTSNLDQVSAKQVLDIIKEMRKKRPDMTVIAVTHDPNFEGIAERIVDFGALNAPKEQGKAALGDRQVFYAKAQTSRP